MLELEVDDGGDSINHDHADWAEAVTPPDPAAIRTGARGGPRREAFFPHPERIRYDGHCLQIEGKDTFIYSATFHYFRTPPELWRDRFQTIKEAGFNTVETYVPWNWHEREMPAGFDDFSKVDLSELEAWLKMAQDEFGFYTIVRPGPFICAEWAGGGYPRWLAKFGPGTGGIGCAAPTTRTSPGAFIGMTPCANCSPASNSPASRRAARASSWCRSKTNTTPTRLRGKAEVPARALRRGQARRRGSAGLHLPDRANAATARIRSSPRCSIATTTTSA